MRNLLLLAAFIAVVHSRLPAQVLSASMYLGAGPGGVALSSTAGVRLDVLTRLGVYARAALRGVANPCEDSLPPTCDYPEGTGGEYAVGLSYPILVGERWTGRASAGGGLVSWQDELDPLVDLTLDMRRVLNERITLMLGVNSVFVPDVDRERRGERAIVPNKDVFFPNVILGLAVRLR
jgi:hypothetical protein